MIYRIGDAEVDTATREIRNGGVVQDVEPRVFDFVEYLIRFRGRMVEKEELLRELWGGRAVSESVMARAAHVARRLLGDAAAIKTLYGRGYRFVAPLTELETRAPMAGATPRGGDTDGFAPRGAERHLIGRRAEMKLVATCLTHVLRNEPRTLAVAGESGIGKTALSEHIAADMRARGGRALWGSCSEVPGAPAYWPFIQLLRELAGTFPRAADGSASTDHAEVEELVHAFGSSPHMLGSGDGQQARFRLFDAIARFLRDAALQQPLALLIDDLHCADTPSLLLLRFLVQHATAARVLIVASYRDAEMRASPERLRWMREVARLPGVVPMRLRGLERDEIDDFVRHAVGAAPTQTDLDYLVAQTAGNPFYLTQLAPLLGRAPEDPHTPSARTGDPLLPRSVIEAIEGHLAVLSDAARKALDAAAVLGRDFDATTLATVLDVGRPEVLALLEAPVDSGLLYEASAAQFRFAHVLIRDVLYRALSAPVRSDLHRRAGEALERATRGGNDSAAGTLAHHFTQATGAEGARKAIRYAALAGDLALERLAYEEAAVQFAAAVRLLDAAPEEDDRPLCELLLKLGAALTRSGDCETARGIFRRATNIARSIETPERLAEVALDLAPGFFSFETGVLDEYLVERLEEALLALGDRDPLLRAHLLSRLAAALYWTDRAERREALCSEVAAIARATGSPEARLRELTANHAALWTPENVADRVRWSEEAIALSVRLGDVDSELINRAYRIVDLLQLGAIEQVRTAIPAFRKVAVAARQPECLWIADLHTAMCAFIRGEYAEIERFGLESLALGERLRYHDATQSGGFYIALACVELGRAREVLPGLEAYVRRYPSVPWAAFAAFVTARTGDRAGTRSALEQSLPSAVTPARDNLWFATMAELSEASLFLGDADAAAVLRPRFAPFSGMHAVIGYGAATYGAVDRYLGQLSLVLGNVGDAIAEMEAGIDQNAKIGAEPYVAHGRRELAVALVRRNAPGDHARAELLAQEAWNTAERLGMVWLLDQLRACGH